jgi:hypothetical protein
VTMRHFTCQRSDDEAAGFKHVFLHTK